MQKRWPFGPGPSSNTCPRCPPQRRQRTSVRTIPSEWSSTVSTASATAGSVKLGQPVPESNFASEENSSAPQAAQRYVPVSFEKLYLPVNGGSVPWRRMTSYCSGVSSLAHSSSDFSTLASIHYLLESPPEYVRGSAGWPRRIPMRR